MAVPFLSVRKPGLFTTIQDGGRYGYQSFGVPVSGVMDLYSHRLANVLVGNRLHAAVLEITLIGPELYVEDDGIIAICGANLSPKINGDRAPMWTSLRVKRGDVLTFASYASGARTYIAVAGEFLIPDVFGSQSTETKTKLGGYYGRPLETGDLLYKKQVSLTRAYRRRTLKPEIVPTYSNEITARVIPGPHLEFFSQRTIHDLFSNTYTISSQSDRMGYRLEGPKLVHTKQANLRSEGTMFGSIQVPASGEPIILMADRQTTGGYPIIGTIISVDLPFVAQAVPGTKIKFTRTTVEEAQALFRQRETWFRLLERLYKD